MAKELPYFQFEPAEYLTKDISFCSLSAQGLFINICAFYWQRQCDLTKIQFLRRFNHEEEFNELIKEGVIDIKSEKIVIKFLDIQYQKATEFSKEQSRKGSLGGRPKNPNKSQTKAEINPNESQTKAIREDKIKEEERKEDKIKEKDSTLSFSFYDSLIKYGFDKELVSEWIKVRKTKKLTNTKTAFNSFIKEVEKTNSDKNIIIKECVVNSWGGFKSEWHKGTNSDGKNPNNEKIIKFNTNANGTIRTLPESEFLKEQERMRGGGYIYNIL